MDFALKFEDGKIHGEGDDPVGHFFVVGDFHPKTLECSWTKVYFRSHDVIYSGRRQGKGIWGTWKLPGGCEGGFHVWPLCEGADEGVPETNELEQPADAVDELALAGH